MACLVCLFVFVFLVEVECGSSNAQAAVCESMSCGKTEIRFPFGLKGGNQSPRCSYPKFQVWCDNRSRTILTLPNAGDLVVKRINYQNQTIDVNDPGECLPKRFLQNLSQSLSSSGSGSPFHMDPAVYSLLNLTFLRCQSNATERYPLSPISCLADPTNSSYSVIVTWSRVISAPLSDWCDVISSAFVPILNMALWPFWPELTSDIELTWTRPDCGDCEAQGEDCGFATDTGLQVGCFPRLQSQKETSGNLPPFSLFLFPIA